MKSQEDFKSSWQTHPVIMLSDIEAFKPFRCLGVLLSMLQMPSMHIYFQHYDLKIPSKISVDTLWVSKHVVCADTSITAHKLIRGPEYFMDDHKEEGNTIFTCSALDCTIPSWFDCVYYLWAGYLSGFNLECIVVLVHKFCVVILFNINTHTQQAHISLTSVWNVTCLLTVQNHTWCAVQILDESWSWEHITSYKTKKIHLEPFERRYSVTQCPVSQDTHMTNNLQVVF
jgi:hypothetical protein